jgi:hypothetical protein
LVHRRQLSARIDGIYGTYRTSVRLGRTLDASCTCPSDEWPCKHIRALRATWDVCPDSFFDLEVFLTSLAAKSTAELVESMRHIIVAFPESLGILGVPEFEPDSDDNA